METTRRNFVKTLSIGSAIALFPELALSKTITDSELSIIDYHVHIDRKFTLESAIASFNKKNMKFGVLEHPGPRYSKMVDDASLLEFIQSLKPYPVLIGLQPVDLKWANQFSSEVLSQLDYILMDAMEIPDGKGGYEKIWEQRFILENKSSFMDRYLDFYVEILENEKLTILANPTFLPICLAPDYYTLWTEKRMDTIIRHAVKNRVAIEINSVTQFPKKPFILMAKEAGARFTFGSNAHGLPEVQNYDYCLEMVQECGITKEDIFTLKTN